MKFYHPFIAIATLWITGCTGLKYVPENERLYTGAKVQVTGNKKITDKTKAVKEVKDLIRPKPNTKILFARPGLWMYYVTEHPKKPKGIKSWLRKNFGQDPVYLSMVDAALVSKAIDAKLYNLGFFDSYSTFRIIADTNRKTASVNYMLYLFEPFKMDTIVFPSDSDDLSKNIKASGKRSLLKEGHRYELSVLMNERVRIDEYLKRRGFYYYNQENILFKLDTSVGHNQVHVYVTIKEETPAKARQVYRIGDVNIYPDYKLGSDTIGDHKRVIDSVNYFSETDYIHPATVLRAVFMKSNHVYDRRKHKQTLSRLSDLGVFKFTNVRIYEKDTPVNGFLTVKIFLTPLPKKSLSAELQAVSKSNNFMGPGLMLTERNRNAFKGAELMIYSMRGSFETQINGPYRGKFTYELNPQVELYIPRFISPVKIKTKSNYVPRTKFIFNYSYLSRVGYFDINAFKIAAGYKWKQNVRVSHDLSVLNINYFRIYNTTPLFEDMIRKNIFLRRRFEEQYIIGTAYSFYYNEQIRPNRKNQFYFNANMETAGNALAAWKRVLDGVKVNSNDPSKVLGIKFAQFMRIDVDVRDYYRILQSKLAGRFMAGWGLPYGNSSTMPYIKQFFSGGAYSLRGFQAYSVGPGSYHPPDSLKNTFFLQQGGEIKTEANLEFRFPIVGVLKGALFTDIGNTWINKKNAEVPGGEFQWNRFMKELSADIGTGIRVDLDLFVLRLDLGIPVRKAWLPVGERWVMNKFDIANKSWRKENLVFNIAFGYPF